MKNKIRYFIPTHLYGCHPNFRYVVIKNDKIFRSTEGADGLEVTHWKKDRLFSAEKDGFWNEISREELFFNI